MHLPCKNEKLSRKNSLPIIIKSKQFPVDSAASKDLLPVHTRV